MIDPNRTTIGYSTDAAARPQPFLKGQWPRCFDLQPAAFLK
jgi:hypothetical protein